MKIAILLSTYNGEDFLAAQLSSIQAQTFVDWELYIRDDGSSDKTIGIITEFTKDTRIHFLSNLSQRNLRVKGSFLSLLTNVTADYYMFCDQDDIWLPNKITVTLNKMLEKELQGEPRLVYTNLTAVTTDLKVIRPLLIDVNRNGEVTTFKRLLTDNVITGCTIMINLALRNLVSLSDTNHIVMHDWWFGLIGSSLGSIACVTQSTILYRQHGNNQVGTEISLLVRLKKLAQLRRLRSEFVESVQQIIFFKQRFYSRLSRIKQDELNEYLSLFDNRKKLSIVKQLISEKYSKQTRLGTISLNTLIIFMGHIKLNNR